MMEVERLQVYVCACVCVCGIISEISGVSILLIA